MASKHLGAATPSDDQEHQVTPAAEAPQAKESILEHVQQNWRVYLLGLSVSLAGNLFGWDTGLIGGVLDMPAFKESFGLSSDPAKAAALHGNIVSVLQAGCFFGAMSGLYLPHRFGRKPTMILAVVIFLVGSLIQTLCRLGSQSASAALDQLYVGRVIGGYGVGLTSAVVPVYLSECAPRSIRGRLAGMYQLLNVSGIAIAFFINYSMTINWGDQSSPAMWQIPFALQCLPGSLFLIGIVFQPESPRWLVQQGRPEDAARSLATIYRKPTHDTVITTLVDEIQGELAGQEKINFSQQVRMTFSSRMTCYRVFIGAMIMCGQQFTGTNAINYYAPQVLRSLGVKGSSAGLLATGVYGIVKIVFTALFLVVAIEQIGRKWSLISGGAIQIFALFWIGIYQAIRPDSENAQVDAAGYLTIAMVYIYVVGYSLGWSSVPWAVSAEVAPNQLRAIAMALATMSQWLFNFVIAKSTPLMLENIKFGTFMLFGGLTTLGVLWVIFFLPETAGIPLELIGFSFEGNLVGRSLQDLVPSKRKAFRAQLLADNPVLQDSTTARDDSINVEENDKKIDTTQYQLRDADINDRK